MNGVQVYEAELKVHLRPNGKVDMANGTYYPNIEVSTTPSVSATAAAATAKSDMEHEGANDLQVNSELVIYRMDDQFKLARKLKLTGTNPFQNWLYMVDARSGEILYKINLLSGITGNGDVYPTHPDLSSVTNKDLLRLDGNGRLQGTYVNVLNDDGAEAYSSNHTFIYSPGNTHFDEVNLYYHVDNFRQNYINGISNSNLNFTQITAHAHGEHPVDGDRNAFYDSNTGEIVFGDGKSLSTIKDFAKEDKVIYHEYSHAVIDDINIGIHFANNEEGAISEGTPDYCAGSFTGRTVYGEYSASFASRNMANPVIESYSEYQSEPNYPVVEGHKGGEFFSSILWEMRNDIAPSILDPLIFDTIFRITGNPDFLAFRDGLLAADDDAYNGSHEMDIQHNFAEKGVGDHIPPTVNLEGSEGVMFEGQSVTFDANASSGHPPYQYQWYYKHDNDSFFSIISGETSSTYDHTVGSSPGETIKVVVTDSESSTSYGQKHITVFGQN